MVSLFQIHKRFMYWPPKNKIKTIKFPSGKKSFIFIGKRDEDGKDEPLLCFVDNQNHKLTWMNEEEVLNLEKLMPRLDSYFSLYLEKAQKVKEQNASLNEEMNRSLHD
ncbi:conserved Plasmodium protein, unknown function [Plasmodium knowlesi strain H]|uniref:Uncharacterized protein n=3 Tax=Plasmodium knowlesi TaxID=5850 RepID=A0A5K1U2Z8_PLAKH|nr:conserved protein, unknown function [Plasmodium knowlesi strain H]OTN68044.1 Uncharacterized protein PKNOH_S04349000 [Plasmodium knowlesi]CAA9990197.1 conserved protein, unknown function [Plasmodium knowlesi strain H]SBO27480.1 conserved Plasmodium protein, unknown function [Plasmodium knowlesi strain H]SBO28479.1 conserved Plasmodium protein, unknown function [Plasmodium knowlesi strain H]VVS79671.1 conserved protein, unknown function [Plasmodium knowlesi strain H]|eukprot:XP_002258104.1 hypothetical protein, conserved in Plasmodium species [Plasmodium knowlesi strain H]